MDFNDLLNCLTQTKNTILDLNNNLLEAKTSYENSQITIISLQKDLSDAKESYRDIVNENKLLQRKINDTSDMIIRLNRQSMAQRVIGVALCFDMLNVPYKFGGEWEKDKAFDCSGFMQITFRVGTQGIVKLPRTSHEQSLVGMAVDLDKIEPGDTLHYDFDNDGKITHVGLAMGDGLMIHTNNPTLGINIIKIADYNSGKGLVKVRRHIGV